MHYRAYLLCRRFLAVRHFIVLPLLSLTLFSVISFGSAGIAEAARKSSSMAIDGHTGRILYSHNIDKPHHPASLTKVMTLYMLFEYLKSGRLNLNSKLKVTANAAGVQPSKLGLKAGSYIRVEEAIKALIVKSANDVAVTIAENLAGSEWKFAQLMTWKARQLGMSKTRFMNASGLPHSQQITTARDMIKLSMRIQKDFPHYYPFFATRSFRYKGRVFKNYNRLLVKMKGVDGIKTGYTRASGYNLTSSVWSGRKHVVAVVMGGKTAKRRDAFMIKVLKKSLRKAKNVARKKRVLIARSPRPEEKRQRLLAQKLAEKNAAKKSIISTRETKKSIEDKNLDNGSGRIVLAGGPKDLSIPVQKLGVGVPPEGPYHIQIGAFGSEEDAKQWLSSIGSRARSLLKGHQSFTMLVPENSIYRARFAGFSEKDARKTCKQLKRRAIDCMAIPAQ